MPENHAWRFFLGMEQVELFGDLSVVSLLGFGNAIEVSLELLFIRPRSAVNPLQLLIVGIAAPISTGDLRQLKRL